MYKCKLCGKKFTELNALYNHLEHKHSEMIPKDMSVQQYYYYMKTGRSNGNCVMCKQPTTWNKNTNKYNRFCGNPKCKEKYVQTVKSRMIAKYGKVHLLNDPIKQREMLANRKISGKYRWEDSKVETTYTGSYELDFLKLLDEFFDWDPEDISMPSPHTYTYEYEGEHKFYIPDVFIHSLDLEIEIKDGGDNPNNHHKIQAVDKEKERLKDEVMVSQKMFHYVKITNKNYSNFFDFLKEVKDGFEKYGDDKKIPRIFKTEDIKTKSIVKESYEIDTIEEALFLNKNKYFKDNEDYLFSNYELRKNNINKLQTYFMRLAKNINHRDDLVTIKLLVNKSYTDYKKAIVNNPDLEKEYYNFRKWTTKDLTYEIKDRLRDINESTDLKQGNIKIGDDLSNYKDSINHHVKLDAYGLKENVIYESSISLAYINNCLQNEYDELLKQYLQDYTDFYHRMLKERPDTVPHINDDIKRAIVFIDGLSKKGNVSNDLLKSAKWCLGDLVNLNKHTKPPKHSNHTQSLRESNIVSGESNVINVKVIYDPITNPRHAFALNDKSSQVVLNESYILQRDVIGTHCTITPGYYDTNNKKILEFTITYNETLNFDVLLKEKIESGVQISSIFNPNDNKNRFIREMSSKLFGLYPEKCEINKEV